jgi:hypothetical protein
MIFGAVVNVVADVPLDVVSFRPNERAQLVTGPRVSVQLSRCMIASIVVRDSEASTLMSRKGPQRPSGSVAQVRSGQVYYPAEV